MRYGLIKLCGGVINAVRWYEDFESAENAMREDYEMYASDAENFYTGKISERNAFANMMDNSFDWFILEVGININ